MKRVISVLLSMIILLSFASCSSEGTQTVVTVDDAKIPADVFTYFLSEALKESLDIKDRKALADAGLAKVAEYVAVNTRFKELGLTLTTAQKEEIASDVEDLWHAFSVYYKSIGVSREVLTKVRTSEEYYDILLTTLYDSGGKYEITEDKIKEYFYSNYIAFQSINGYLTTTAEDGSTVKLDDQEVEAIKTEFAQMSSQISGGANINEVNSKYALSHGYETTSVETTIYKKGGAFFPKNFFDSASSLKYNTPGVIFSEEYIFLVVLIDMSKKEDVYYKKYRDECLITLASEDYKNKISAWVEKHNFKSVQNEVDKCCSLVLEKV